MAKKKIKRRSRVKPKYIFRRFLLLLVIAGVAGTGVWYVFFREDNGAEPVSETGQNSQTMASASVSEPESSSEPESQPEEEQDVSEPEEDPEPEPEPEPTGVNTAEWNLLLVNNTNLLPEGFTVELETVVDTFQVDTRIADSIRRMFAQAKADGINLMICSAHRTPEYQEELFQNKTKEYIAYGYDEEAAIEATATMIARPRTSEHHTGLAVDIVTPSYQNLDEGFAETPAFKWLDENAHQYGFILRYPQNKESITQIIYEPWHYRYVGEDHAAAIKQSGVCLEEYIYVALRDQQLQEQQDEEATEPEEE